MSINLHAEKIRFKSRPNLLCPFSSGVRFEFQPSPHLDILATFLLCHTYINLKKKKEKKRKKNQVFTEKKTVQSPNQDSTSYSHTPILYVEKSQINSNRNMKTV